MLSSGCLRSGLCEQCSSSSYCLSSAASGLLIIRGEVWVSEEEREGGFLELRFKTEFNQNHRDPQFLPH